MEILYILLGGEAVKSVEGMTHAMFIAYDSEEAEGSDSVLWSADGPHLAPPISYLVSRAQLNAWDVAAKRVLQRHRAEPSWMQWLEKGPQVFAQLDVEKFEPQNASTDGSQTDALIARELKHAARKIIERKTAFVFPAKWPDKIAVQATKLIRLMVRDLCAYLREVPIEKGLPWTFLSMSADPKGENPLGDFIRLLHSEMLADKSGVDVIAMRQKNGAILLSGPTGSGKSYAARALANDTKYGNRLVEVNLAAVAEEQLESRMRGYKAGTFTGGAKEGRAGWFEKADNGVLFLDEFQSVSVASQVQLLDLLSAVSNEIHIARTGADHERQRFSVKVILAINEDIDILLREKRLRKDIYFRVRSVEAFPSLKERLDRDIEHRYLRGLMASYRWKSLRTIDQLRHLEGGWGDMVPTFFPIVLPEALSELANQDWEGNFRELERVAFDIYYECDYQHKSIFIDRARVTHVVKSWHIAAPGVKVKNHIDGMSEAEQGKLNDIQQALRKSSFIISTVLKSQPYYRSRPPLKKYLQSHIDKLDEDILGDSHMIRFLGIL